MIHSQLSASVWAVSIVLMDAYLHIPFHLLSRSFLGFSVLGQDLPTQSSEFWLFRSVSGSFQGSFGARPLLAEIFRPPCRLRGPCPLLQAADEASSASSSEGLHSLDRLSGLTCSLEFRIQGVVRGVVLSSPSRREAFCCIPLHWSSPRTRQVRGGGQFFTLTVCQGFGRRRRSLIISILWN